MVVKGLEMVRKDQCELVRRIQKEVVEILLLEEKSTEEVGEEIRRKLKEVELKL